MLVSVTLSPSVSFRNRVVIIEVITSALEVCDMKMVRGSAGKTWFETPGPKRA